MGLLALILGVIAILVSLLPTFGLTQMVGLALGLIALFVGGLARSRAKRAGRGLVLATAGLSASIVSIIVSLLVFATCQLMTHEMGRKAGQELKGQGAKPAKVMVSDPKSR